MKIAIRAIISMEVEDEENLLPSVIPPPERMAPCRKAGHPGKKEDYPGW